MQNHTRLFGGLIATTLVLTSLGVSAGESAVALKGAEEVPTVTTMAEGSGKFTVSADGTVAGSVTTKSMVGVAAHIHLGAPGKNGPPVVTLEKISESTWSTPAGAKLTEAQMASYKSGDLYVNVHSAAHPGGEIRAQLRAKD